LNASIAFVYANIYVVTHIPTWDVGLRPFTACCASAAPI
jgi:hypothetical protein